MNIKEAYHQEIKRILGIGRPFEFEFKFSNILLFREFQTRLFEWKSALNFDGNDFFNKKKSYHNLFLDLNPIWIEELISEKQIVEDLNRIGWSKTRSGLRQYSGYFMFLYINWEIFKAKEEIAKYSELPHPYETIFMILERQGLIDISDNKFEINDITYLRYDNQFKLPSTETGFLNFIDQNVTNFPNQEKVNELWDMYRARN